MKDCPRAVVGYLSSFHKASLNSKIKSDPIMSWLMTEDSSPGCRNLTEESQEPLDVKLRFCTAASVSEHRYDATVFFDHLSDFCLVGINKKL